MRPVVEGVAPTKLRHLAAPYIEILAELGRWDELAEFAERIEPVIEVTPYLRPIVDRAQGRALAAVGDSAEAAARLRAALAGFSALLYQFEAARTAEALAEIPGVPNRDEAFRQALETYEALAASPSMARLSGRSARPPAAHLKQ
jgi:hypothetical protein